jgi:hypothetical protein
MVASKITIRELEERANAGDPASIQEFNTFAADLVPVVAHAAGAQANASRQLAQLTEEPQVIAEQQRTRRKERRERMTLVATTVPAVAAIAMFAVKLLA